MEAGCRSTEADCVVPAARITVSSYTVTAAGSRNAAATALKQPQTTESTVDGTASPIADGAVEPGLRCGPVTPDRDFGNFENFRDFLHSQSAEVTQLDDLTFPGSDGRKPGKSIIQGEDIRRLFPGNDHSLVQRRVPGAAAALGVVAFAGVIHKDSAHHLRSKREEVRTALPAHMPLIHQAKIGLVDKPSGLKRMIAALERHVMARQPAEFVVNERYQFVPRRFVPVAPIGKQRAHFFQPRPHHATPVCKEMLVANGADYSTPLDPILRMGVIAFGGNSRVLGRSKNLAGPRWPAHTSKTLNYGGTL